MLGRPAERGPEGGWRALRTLAGNLGLRGATSVARFALMLGMAHFLSLADLGLLGLVIAVVNISITGIGLNFFQFNTRELLSRPREAWPRMIRDQAVLHLGSYAVGIPLLLLVFAVGALPWSLAGWVVVIVLLDHLSQELQRLLVVISRPVASNVLLFLRSGAWVYVAVGLMVRFPALRRVETVWLAWSIGAAAAVAWGLWSLRELPWRRDLGPVDVAWLRRGVGSALVLLVGVVCLRGIFVVDRYMIQAFTSLEAVGAYTFFAGVANTLMVLTESGVLLTQFPKLVQSFQAGDLAAYRRTMRTMTVGSLVLVGALGTGVAVLIHPVLRWIGKEALSGAMPVLWILMLATVVQVVGQLVRNALYVRSLDRSIAASCAVGLAVALGAGAVAVPAGGILAAGVTTLLAVVTMGLASWALLWRASRRSPPVATP